METVEALIAELGDLSGHKYLTPEQHEQRNELIRKLVFLKVLSIDHDHKFRGIALHFTFVDPFAEEYEAIYNTAFGKRLMNHGS